MLQSRTQRARNRSALPGVWAEQRAWRLLRERGWQLLASRWHCRWGELDLVVTKPGRLLVVEVKGRHRCGADGWGVAALGAIKRRRLARALSCWLAEHPEQAQLPLEVVCALVPLPPADGSVRWLRLEALSGAQGDG
jgi:putative endonuclease